MYAIPRFLLLLLLLLLLSVLVIGSAQVVRKREAKAIKVLIGSITARKSPAFRCWDDFCKAYGGHDTNRT